MKIISTKTRHEMKNLSQDKFFISSVFALVFMAVTAGFSQEVLAKDMIIKTSMRIDPFPTVDGKVIKEAGLSCSLSMSRTIRRFFGSTSEAEVHEIKDLHPASKFKGGKSVPISVTIDTKKKLPSGYQASKMSVNCAPVVNTVSGGNLLGALAVNDRYFDMSKSHIPTYSKRIR